MGRSSSSTAARAIPVIACAVLVAVGVWVHRDYGVSWDEPIQRSYGQIVTRYVLRGDAGLFQHPERVYGPAHELLLAAWETVSGARDMADVIAGRHLINFLVFALGVAAFYRLALMGLGTRLAALLATAALVLSPPIFAHAFFNSKDLPFLAWFTVSVLTLVRFLDRPGLWRALVHGAACAWLVAIRVPGILVPALTLAIVAFAIVRDRATAAASRRLLPGAVMFTIATMALTVVCWPTLWRDPAVSFWHALQTMSRYPWEGEVLFAGRLISAREIPWYYALVWIAITTPLAYLAGAVVGLPAVLHRAWREIAVPSPAAPFWTIVLAWLVGPLASVVLFQSVLYDGWRQLYFIYPALLLIAAAGFQAAWRVARARWADPRVRGVVVVAAALVLMDVIGTTRFMIAAHPFQHVYFNQLAGGVAGAQDAYDLDYWGLAYRRGLEQVARLDPDPVITVFGAEGPIGENARILPVADRRRIVIVDHADDAEYALVGTRARARQYRFPDEVARVAVADAPILTIARLQRGVSLTPLTKPLVVEVRRRNAALTAGADEGTVRREVAEGIRRVVGQFVRDARVMDVQVITRQPDDIGSGTLSQIRVRIEDAEAGDFRGGRAGLPLRRLDVTLSDVVLDLERLRQGQFVPALLEGVTVNELDLDAAAMNLAMPRMRPSERHLRIHFDAGLVRVESLESPRADASARLWVAPDPRLPGSENLWFRVDTLRWSGWRVPLAWLVQLVLDRFSPAIDVEKVDARLSLGTLEIAGQRLRLGVTLPPRVP